jgi:uncharacterized repeat protein (TIGR03803 family)
MSRRTSERLREICARRPHRLRAALVPLLPPHRSPLAEPLESRLFLSSTSPATVLANLDASDDIYMPVYGSMVVSGSTLYGVTTGSVTSGDSGTVFSEPISGGTPTILATFDGTDGSHPQGGLILSGDKLYGTTANGGADGGTSQGNNGEGTVFSLPITGGTPTVLASFDAADGADPTGDLLLSGGTLYGTTSLGGPDSSSQGTVFSLPVTGGTPTTLATFTGADGASPVAGLILSGNTLYGTTANGGPTANGIFAGDGTVFSLPITGGTPTVLAAFDGTDGLMPDCDLVLSGGTLYGTTQSITYGDGNLYGTVFSLPIAGGTPTDLATFTLDSYNEYLETPGNLILSGDTLYGNAVSVYSLPITGGTPTLLASPAISSTFDGYTNPLVLSEGTLYGTTERGGTNGDGNIFSVPAPGSTGGGPPTPTPTPTPTATLAVTAAAAQSAVTGSAQTFDLGSFTETDATAPYTATVNWGDGSADTTVSLADAGTITAQSHTYAAAGTDTASVTVSDAAGDTSNIATFAVTVSGASTSPTSTNTAGLTVTVAKSSLPTLLVAGAKLKGAVTIDIDNATGAKLDGTGTVDLYATNAAGTATLVGTVKKGLKLANGSSTPATIAAKAVVLPAGTYTVLPTLTVGSDMSMAATGTSITVAPATVTLAAAVTAASPSAVAAGKTVTITLSLTNTGNVNSTGAATAAITLTVAGTATTVTLPAIPAKATVKFGGKPVIVKLKVKVPVGTAAATYDPTVTFTQGSNMATAVGTTPITVS